MTAAELKILIQEGEGTTLEFKENLSAAFARELVGMANTLGGRILLGVRDDGTVAGVKETNNEPVFEETGFVTATFFPNPEVRAQGGTDPASGRHQVEDEVAGGVTPQVPRKYQASTPQVIAVLTAASGGDKTREQLQTAADIKDREHFRKTFLKPLLTTGMLARTIPDKPRSSKQRYRITPLGLEVLKKTKEKT